MTATASVATESERATAVMQSGVVFAGDVRGAQQVVVELASELGLPVAAVTVVGQYYLHFKVSTGVTMKFIPREQSFCAFTIQQDEPLIVPDLRLDVRFRDLPFVVGPPQIRFYAGAPLRTLSGHRLGTICVMDVKPRTLALHEQIRLVEAAETMTQLLRCQQAVTKAAGLRQSIASEMHRGDVCRVRQLRDQLSEALKQQLRWTSPFDAAVAFAK
jgi:GAF domain-containing protein